MNEEIRASEVRVVDDEGKQVGVLSLSEALRYAREKGLDLVEIGIDSKPTVCKTMDFGKYLFKLGKQRAVAKKKQRLQKRKQIRVNPNIGEQDYLVKLASAKRFLEEGDRVEFHVRFRGRELMYRDFGTALLIRLKMDLQDVGEPEKEPLMQGRQMVMAFAPKKRK